MEQLPMLYRRVDYSYAIEVKNDIFCDKGGFTELVAYAIYRKMKSKNKYVLDREGNVINRKLRPGQSFFTHYCKILADFYGCTVRHVTT